MMFKSRSVLPVTAPRGTSVSKTIRLTSSTSVRWPCVDQSARRKKIKQTTNTGVQQSGLNVALITGVTFKSRTEPLTEGFFNPIFVFFVQDRSGTLIHNLLQLTLLGDRPFINEAKLSPRLGKYNPQTSSAAAERASACKHTRRRAHRNGTIPGETQPQHKHLVYHQRLHKHNFGAALFQLLTINSTNSFPDERLKALDRETHSLITINNMAFHSASHFPCVCVCARVSPLSHFIPKSDFHQVLLRGSIQWNVFTFASH